MGRHAAPELDSPTEVIVVPPARPVLDDGAIDLAALFRNADRKTLRVAAAGGAALVAAVCLPGLIGALPHSSSSSSSGVSDSSVAQAEGKAFATELVAQGYDDGASIEFKCSAKGGGYSGPLFEDYMLGCDGVALSVDYPNGY